MQATLHAPRHMDLSAQLVAVATDGCEAEGSGTMVNSQELLQGRKAVTIQHNGALYRLQATRLGKLILTK